MKVNASGYAFGTSRIRNRRLYVGASCVVLSIVCSHPTAALADTYFVGNETELNNAIMAANGDGDATATIVLTQSFGVLGTTALPTPTKPLTIDTQGFVLSGVSIPGPPGTPGSVSFLGPFPGSSLTLTGTLTGAAQTAGAARGAGLIVNGTGASSTAQVINNGSISGGAATINSRGGIGVSMLDAHTFINNGAVSGGAGLSSSSVANGAGVNLFNGGTVINSASGVIRGGDGQATESAGAGVYIRGLPGVDATLINYGAIRGGSVVTGVGNAAVLGRGNLSTIENFGVMEGGTGAAAIAFDQSTWDVYVINSGAIRAGDGSTTAILFGQNAASDSTLELRYGSQITGDVIASALAFNDVLRLGGSADATFDVSSIGAAGQYQNFDLFEKTGSGTWTLTGAGTATTDWSILEGTLQIGDGGASGSIVGDVANDGALSFNRSDTYAFAGVISGAGVVNQIGAGATVLTAANTYSGGTTISGGVLSVSSDSNLGDAAGGLSFNGGVLQVTGTNFNRTSRAITWGAAGGGLDIADQANAFTVDGALTGGGALTKLGAGALILAGNNTYAGGTTIGAGTLQIGAGGTSGSIVGDVVNEGVLAFNRSDALTFAGAISGSGSVSHIGIGTTILTGASAYTGGTTVSAGTLQLGNGGTTGSIDGDVLNEGTLVFNRSDAIVFDGEISGGGVIRQAGAGMTTFTADSSAFTGRTFVAAGALSINGTLGGSIDVAAGARLQGVGEVGAAISAGVIAPGNSIGVLIINGDYQSAGGILEIEAMLSQSGSPADRLLIAGDVAGTTIVHVVNIGGAGAPTGSSSVDGISIIQVAGASSATAFQLAGGYAAAGPYQYRLNAFDPANSANAEMDGGLASAGAADFWDYRLQSALDDNGAPLPVPQLPGYQALPSGALRYGWTILDSLHKRLGEIRPSPDVQGGDANAELFVRGSGEHGDFNGENGPDYDQTIWFTQAGGNVVGWDVGGEGGALRGGVAASYGGSRLDVKSSSARVDLKGASVALASTYHAAGGWHIDAVALGARYNAEVTTDERGETGAPDGWGAGFSVEGGYPVDLDGGVVIEPQVQLVYQRVWFEAFTDIDDIVVDLHDGESLRWRVGARVQKTFVSTDGGGRSQWSPYAQIDVINEMLDGGGINATGVNFGADVGGSSVRVSGGVNARLGAGLTLYASAAYEAGVGDGSADSFGGAAGLRLSF